jgi:membrane fusion protein (multidrug efflux system)
MSSKIPATADSPIAAPPVKKQRGFFLKLLGFLIVVALIAWVAWYYLVGRWYESTDDAYVNGNIVQITPQIVGTVISIGADDGDLVKQGDVLVRFDRADADVALAQAQANLANTVRRVRGLYSNASGAKAEVAMYQTALDKALADYNRRRDLAKSGAISAEELAHAQDQLNSTQNSLITAQQEYETRKVLVDDTVVASHPDVRAAAAQVRAAYLNDVRTILVAPVTGYITQRSVQLGQRVQPGVALMAVVPLHQVWVDANFKETQLTHMRIGQTVDVTSDVYGGSLKFKAHVQSLGIGTGSAFSLLPAQNATGNWIKIVQRVPVRVVFDDPNELDHHPLRIGMSLSTTVGLRDQKGPMLAQQAPTQPVLSTDVYELQLAKVDGLIEQIIHTNMAGESMSK